MVAAAVAATAVVGGVASSQAASKSAKAMAGAANSARDLSEQQLARAREDTRAERQTGQNALYRVADLLGVDRGMSAPRSEDFSNFNSAGFDKFSYDRAMKDYTDYTSGNVQKPQDILASDPGYQFRIDQGNKALDRYQSANRSTGGGAIKEAIRYNQDYASNEYGNAVNRLFTLAGYGDRGIQTATGAGDANAARGGNAAYTIGNAQAGAAQQQAAGWNNAIQGGVSNYFTAGSAGLL